MPCQSFLDPIQEPPTLDLVNDCRRFINGYSGIICASPLHIYHLALGFTSETSIIRKLHESNFQDFARIVCGAQESLDSNTTATTSPFTVGAVVWSPCNRFIAIGMWDTIRVDILDSTTLRPIQSLGFPRERPGPPSLLVFSPDSRKLTYCGRRGSRFPTDLSISLGVIMVNWDLQTGAVVSAIELEQPIRSESHRITYSMDGNEVAIIYRLYSGTVLISIFDIVSGVHTHDVDCPRLEISCVYHIWTHGESIQLVTSESTRIAIWEVGFAPGATLTEVKTLSSLDGINRVMDFESLSPSYRVALAGVDRDLVWNPPNSKSLPPQARMLYDTTYFKIGPASYRSRDSTLSCGGRTGDSFCVKLLRLYSRSQRKLVATKQVN